MQVLIGGDTKGAKALARALESREVDVTIAHGIGTEPAPALVALERMLEARRPTIAVALGAGTAGLAMAITASKLGIPTAASLDHRGGRDGERRIVQILAGKDIGPVSDDAQATEAAERLVAWRLLD